MAGRRSLLSMRSRRQTARVRLERLEREREGLLKRFPELRTRSDGRLTRGISGGGRNGPRRK